MNKMVTGVVAYLGLPGWVIAYLAGDKEGAKFHLNQALVLTIVSIICAVTVVGMVLIPVLAVFQILGIIAAVKDEEKELPLIGQFKILK